MSIELVLRKQNRDGGWPYVRGGSWTEPTVYAVLAMLCAGQEAAAQRGISWLLSMQRPDGGWAPRAEIEESSWVTSLVALLPPERVGEAVHRRAIQWLAGMTGQESSLLYQVREWLLGNPRQTEEQFPGWPWVPGAAAWVAPTAFAILALEKECRRRTASGLEARIHTGRRFLLLHMCHEGGWNHGSVRALGYESRPYPETTGLALAALRGIRTPEVNRSLDAARRFLRECRSADAFNWLRLGLLAHGELPPAPDTATTLERRSVPEASLDLVVSAALQGKELFWQS